ncbi:MAG: LapA family protein [Candidatus Omnitrophota bacterium]
MSWKTGIIIALLLLLVIFTVQNYAIVEIRFLLWSFKTSRAIIIFIAVLVGVITGYVIARRSKSGE